MLRCELVFISSTCTLVFLSDVFRFLCLILCVLALRGTVHFFIMGWCFLFMVGGFCLEC